MAIWPDRKTLTDIIRIKLLRNILFGYLIISAVFPLYGIFFGIPAFRQFLVKDTENQAIHIARRLLNRLNVEKHLLSEKVFPGSLNSYVKDLQKDFHLEKVKIFTQEGEVLYSTDAHEIGNMNTKDYFHKIVSRGEIFSKWVKTNKSSAEGQSFAVDVMEVYVPVLKDGRFIGAFEIYYDVTEQNNEFNAVLWRSFLALGVLGALIFFAVAWFLVNASKIYTRRIEEKAELNQTQARYLEMVEASSEAIVSINEKMQVIQWNSAASRLFGYQSEEVMNRSIGLMIDEEYITGQMESFQPFVRLGNSADIAKTVATEGRRKDGAILALEFSFSMFAAKGVRTFTLIIRDVTVRKQAEAEHRRSFQIQSILNRLLRVSLDKVPLEKMLQQSLELILSIPWFSSLSRGAVFLAEDNMLAMKVHHGLGEPITTLCERVEFGKCLCGLAASSGKLVFADRVDERHVVRFEGMPDHGHYCTPLVTNGDILGVIDLQLDVGHQRDENEEGFLQAAAHVMVGAIKGRKADDALKETLQDLRDAMGGTVQLLSSTLEIRDPYTAGHQKRVADLARAIANEMGVSKEIVDGIRMGALIHDIGKISIPAEILSKPGRISAAEFALIKTHPEVGYNLLREIDFPWPVSRMVYQHHEKMDGSGYPQGLSGQDICLEARILCVADVVEAIASHRPYRAALGVDVALEEIEKQKGILFDSQAVEACVRLFREKGFQMK
ncbi:MAG: HD domain-containing protein [Desulfobacterales bacterium]|nr:HD domain-containing protein [Desulfobacterales bacterium]